jgi:hypothetical protein
VTAFYGKDEHETRGWFDTISKLMEELQVRVVIMLFTIVETN